MFFLTGQNIGYTHGRTIIIKGRVMKVHDRMILMIRQRRWGFMILRMDGQGDGKAVDPMMDGFK